MFALRRASVRGLSRSTPQLSTTSPVCRVSSLRFQKPTLYRSLHQSWRSLAEEEKRAPLEEAEYNQEQQMEDIREESVATPDVVDVTQQTHVPSEENAPQGQSGSITEQASNMASSIAGATRSATSTISEAAQRANPFQNTRGPRAAPTAEVVPNRILYIGNLFFEVTSPQLELEFGRFGEIVNSRIVTDERGLSRGFAYVEFSTQDAADQAVQELNQTTFQGRRMSVQYHNRPERAKRTHINRAANPISKTLYIGNMSYQMSDRDLNDLFRDIRNVMDVRVAIDRRSGQPRGFAHADFVDVESAERAKEYLEQKVVYGRQLRVDYTSNSPEARKDGGLA